MAEMSDTRAWFDNHIRELQERIAYAEQARDNAVASREEVDERRKKSGDSAGKRIAALTRLVRKYAKFAPVGNNSETEIAEILSNVVTNRTPDGTT